MVEASGGETRSGMKTPFVDIFLFYASVCIAMAIVLTPVRMSCGHVGLLVARSQVLVGVE